jgi:YggT family protein
MRGEAARRWLAGVCENRPTMNVLAFLAETVGSILVSACLLRAYAPWANVSARNPLMHFAIALTDWAVKPLRALVPATRRFDWAALAAAFLIALLLAAMVLFGPGLSTAAGLGSVLLFAVYWVVKWGLWALMALVILQAILSWVNPDAPIAPVIDQLTRPFLSPLRKVVPLVGNVDLSPLILIVVINLLLGLMPDLLGRIARL